MPRRTGSANPDLIPRPEVSKANPPALSWRRTLLAALPTVWVLGTLSFLLVGSARVLVLMRLLAKAPLASDEVQHLAGSVATRLGIAKPPRVCFVAGVVCPALWAFGRRPRVIIPVSLWERLDESKRRTLLAHELAHLRRGDHWVRLLEFIAGVMYWWHPAVWMARRQIHDFEEQCCDAWVLWALPASAHSYGSALLEAVDFVSTSRPMRPALTAGLGEFRHLKRRLLMIKQGTVSRALSRTNLLAICGAAALALPLAPGLAQEVPSALPNAPGAANVPPSADKAPSAGDRAEIDQARAEVQKLQAEYRRAQANLMQARSRLAVLEHGSAGEGGGFGGGVGGGGGGGFGGGYGVVGGGIGSFGGGGGTGTVRAGGAYAGQPGQPPTGGMAGNGVPSPGAAGGMGSAMNRAPSAGGGGGMGTAGGPPSAMPRNRFGAMGGGGSTSASPARTLPREGVPQGDAERRLEGLEDQLKQLMDQVKDLRAMQQRQQPDLHDKPGSSESAGRS